MGKHPFAVKARARRRAAIALALAVALLAIALSSASSASTVLPSSTPRRAADLVDSIGVNTHLGYRQGPYADVGRVTDAIDALGVRHIRQSLWAERPDQHDAIAALGARGITADLGMGGPGYPHGSLADLLAVVRAKLASSTASLEGPNEYDVSGDPAWAANLRTYQQGLFDAVNAEPALGGIPVLAPPLTIMRDPALLGDVTGMSDLNNRHTYPLGAMPESNLDDQLAKAAVAGPHGLVVTESGYHDNLTGTGAHLPASERAAGTYVPRLVLEHFRRGIVRTYLYELVDEPQLTVAQENVKHFGLLRADFSPKPSYTSLRNLLTILRDPSPSAASFRTTRLRYDVSAPTGADVHQVLLQKSDGTWYLALWNASSVWDATSRTDLTPPTVPVTVSLGAALHASVYEPGRSALPRRELAATRTIALDLGPDVTVLQIRR